MDMSPVYYFAFYQDSDSGLSYFVVTYFSYIVLGLVLTIGYVFYRLFPKKKKNEDGKTSEDILREAENEARLLKEQKKMQDDKGPQATEAEELVLALSADQLKQQEEIRRLAEKTNDTTE